VIAGRRRGGQGGETNATKPTDFDKKRLAVDRRERSTTRKGEKGRRGAKTTQEARERREQKRVGRQGGNISKRER